MGRKVWWRFRHADGDPWGLTGLWSTWTDKATDELVDGYTTLTLIADGHPIMSRMHEADPKDRKSTRLNSSHGKLSRMPSSA